MNYALMWVLNRYHGFDEQNTLYEEKDFIARFSTG